MFCAGYLLVGGKSSRMGCDKALLAWNGCTMAELLARRLSATTDPVVLIGDPARYQHLGLRVVPDHRPGEGPLAGIQAALRDSVHGWNLILSCDMPEIPLSFLQKLADDTAHSTAAAIVPEPLAGALEPLCAVYHKRCLPAVEEALHDGRRRVKDLLLQLPLEKVTDCERSWFHNLNTPDDWTRFQASPATL